MIGSCPPCVKGRPSRPLYRPDWPFQAHSGHFVRALIFPFISLSLWSIVFHAGLADRSVQLCMKKQNVRNLRLEQLFSYSLSLPYYSHNLKSPIVDKDHLAILDGHDQGGVP